MSGPLEGKVALVSGATRGGGRGIAVALGEAGATVYATGRSTREQRSEIDRPETIEETAELVTAAGGEGIAVAVDHLDPAQVAGAGRADRLRAGPARRARERHLGLRASLRVEVDAVGARPRQRPAAASARDRHPSDHEPSRAAAAGAQSRRAGGGGHRRHRRLQRRPLPGGDVLRPRQDVRHAPGVGTGQGARPARGHRGGAHSRLDALGAHARAPQRERVELARCDRAHAALLHLRVTALRRPGGGRTGRGSRQVALERAIALQRRARAGVRLHRHRRNPGPTAGATWSRSWSARARPPATAATAERQAHGPAVPGPRRARVSSVP